VGSGDGTGVGSSVGSGVGSDDGSRVAAGITGAGCGNGWTLGVRKKILRMTIDTKSPKGFATHLVWAAV